MKKTLAILLTLLFVFLASACERSQQQTEMGNPGASDGAGEEPGGLSAENRPGDAVKTDGEETLSYQCDLCGGACTYFSGRFKCPQLTSRAADAQAINKEIAEEYDKYLAAARVTADRETGLAYAFTYDVFDDGSFAVIKTNVATAMAHTGEYSYTMYYYDLVRDRAATSADFCRHMVISGEDVASFVRISMQESDTAFSDDQIASIDADSLSLFFGEDGYFVKAKNNMAKMELTFSEQEFSAAASEIAQERRDLERAQAEKEADASRLREESESGTRENSRNEPEDDGWY